MIEEKNNISNKNMKRTEAKGRVRMGLLEHGREMEVVEGENINLFRAQE